MFFAGYLPGAGLAQPHFHLDMGYPQSLPVVSRYVWLCSFSNAASEVAFEDFCLFLFWLTVVDRPRYCRSVRARCVSRDVVTERPALARRPFGRSYGRKGDA